MCFAKNTDEFLIVVLLLVSSAGLLDSVATPLFFAFLIIFSLFGGVYRAPALDKSAQTLRGFASFCTRKRSPHDDVKFVLVFAFRIFVT